MDLEDSQEASALSESTLVRVAVSPHQRELATVLAQNEDGTLLVRIPALWNSERTVDAAAVQAPLDFEMNHSGCDDAEEYKARGNLLFRLADFTAALQQYEAGIALLRRDLVCSVGADVLHVLPDQTRAGYVTDVNGPGEQQEMMLFEEPAAGESRMGFVTVDVAYVAGAPEDMTGVRLRDLHPRVDLSNLGTLYLYLALLSNCARSLSKKSLPQEALECVTAVIQILKYMVANERVSLEVVGQEAWNTFKTALANAYVLRGHIHIQMSKFSKAQADANLVLSRIDRNSQKARDLHTKCQRRAQQTERQNKRLARDVSRWVEEAMHRNGQEAPPGDGIVDLPQRPDPGRDDDADFDGSGSANGMHSEDGECNMS
uniref:Uncharacterized protein n=1 Tax=Pinguiococcus pyrenoidosus TaxID=172671 RepID=A0A7R9YB94_9STRA